MRDLADLLARLLQVSERRVRVKVRAERVKRVLPESLRPVDFVVLRTIRRYPGLSIRKLSNHVGLTHSTTSSMVRRYERAGLLERLENPRDRRTAQLFLTPQAQGWNGKFMEPVVEEMFRTWVGRLTKANQQQLHCGVEALLQVVEEDETFDPQTEQECRE
ncbi:MarR family transcriptional regulator [Alicyclobacillaceae bacterium I2511]|nr:MarR family transcriptional regulator [Alicyclobacillaceae bacterium I2511]